MYYIDSCAIYTSLQELRDKIGSNEYSLIQGLNARQSRMLYHELLPKCIIDSPKYQHLSICEKYVIFHKIMINFILFPSSNVINRANKAFLARKANKAYIRERSNILVSSFAKIMDFYRHWKIDGASLNQLWNKKAKKIGASKCIINGDKNEDNILWNDNECENVCIEILKSSTKTNEWVDGVTGAKLNDNNKVNKDNNDKDNDKEAPLNSKKRDLKKPRKPKPIKIEDLDINEMIHNEL